MASLKQRGTTCFVQWYEAGRQRRRSLRTDSLQIAKEKLRQFESAQFRGDDCRGVRKVERRDSGTIRGLDDGFEALRSAASAELR